MVFLVLAVACSTGIAVIFRLTEGRFDRFALLTVNYATAIVFASVRLSIEGTATGLVASPDLIALGCTLGALFIGGFALFSKAIGQVGLALPTATMRLSVALPFVASWVIWNEVPSVAQVMGLLLAAVALLLITRERAPATGAALPVPDPSTPGPVSTSLMVALLVLLFVTAGLVDTGLKLYEEQFAGDHPRPLFLLFVFAVAFILGVCSIVLQRVRSGRWPRRGVLGWGMLLGLVNYASVEFILLALARLPGTVVFPANNVAIVACATLVGVVVWGERLTRGNRAGLAAAVLALVLLAF